MPITLKITSYQRLTPDQDECFTSDQKRFSIGRADSNHWTLPDPQRFMSGTHCWIEDRHGAWFITDTSTNGVFINKSDQRMNKNDSVEIKDGDSIRIGDYDFTVEITRATAGDAESTGLAPDLSANPFGDSGSPGSDVGGNIGDDLGGGGIDDIIGTPASTSASAPLQEDRPYLKEVNTPLSQMDDSLLGDEVSIDDLYDLDESETPDTGPSLVETGEAGSSLRQHYTAPETHPEQGESPSGEYGLDLSDIPENWDDDTDMVEAAPAPAAPAPETAPPIPPPASEAKPVPAVPEEPSPPATAPPTPPTPEPRPEPVKAAAAATPVAAGSLLASFATGAELDASRLHVQDESEFFRELGALFKIMTEGLMQVIASRSQIKSEFRLEQTMIAPTENNPFKFSASAQEAMTRLFNQGDQAYLSGLAATEEAVDDISAHQMAVLAGTEAALRDILRRFNPEKLEKRFSKDSLIGKAMPSLEKARCWDFYKVLYGEISEAADDDFQQLFGSEFSKAYEDQLERLKLARREK
jgi:type VI secretion system protein